MLWHNLKKAVLSRQPRNIDKQTYLCGVMVQIGQKSYKQLQKTFGGSLAAKGLSND